MRRITSLAPPAQYVSLVATASDFSQLSSEQNIRLALWQQQKGRCAYCERVLRDPSRSDHRTRIEHFHPQSGSAWSSDCAFCSGARSQAAARTAWTNLLLCCDGNEAAGSDFTCDKSKANMDVCDKFRNPKVWHASRLVDIDRNGFASPVTGLPVGAADVIHLTLRLNADHLIAARLSVIAAYTRMIKKEKDKHHNLTPSRRTELAAKLRVKADDSEYATTWLSLADRLSPPVLGAQT